MKKNPILKCSHRLLMFSEQILGWKVLFVRTSSTDLVANFDTPVQLRVLAAVEGHIQRVEGHIQRVGKDSAAEFQVLLICHARCL